MPNVIATTAISLVAGSMPSIEPPGTAPDLSANLNQLEKQIQHIEIQPGQTANPLELPKLTIPSYVEVGPNISIHPYGPPFQFNGLTVYVEPIATASATVGPLPATKGASVEAIEILHPLATEPVAFAPATVVNKPATHP